METAVASGTGGAPTPMPADAAAAGTGAPAADAAVDAPVVEAPVDPAAASGLRRRKVMAVCSGGGHWVEMRRIMPAFAGLEVVWVSTEPAPAGAGPAGGWGDGGAAWRYHRVRNATRRDRLALAATAWQIARLLRRERPEVVVSTGAAPGVIALALAKLLVGSRTLWIDSIAAGERLSLSGRLARPVADAWLTQWPHLARPGGPEHWGAVL